MSNPFIKTLNRVNELRIEAAVDDIKDLIVEGYDYCDAEFKVSCRTGIDAKILRKEYDKNN